MMSLQKSLTTELKKLICNLFIYLNEQFASIHSDSVFPSTRTSFSEAALALSMPVLVVVVVGACGSVSSL